MKQTKIEKHMPQITIVIVYALLFVAVMSLMNYVQNLLESDVQINLTEIVTRNKDVITSKLSMEVNQLELIGNHLADRLDKADEQGEGALETIFLEYMKDKEDKNLFLAGREGNTISPYGKIMNISGRQYFRLAKQGTQNISERIVSRQDGEEVFVISVPIEYQGKIIGTIQKIFTPKEMYSLCAISLFSAQGYMYIINKEGYILMSSQQEEYNQETENYYRMIYAQGNTGEAKLMQSNIENNQSGFMDTVMDGKKIFSAYTPIESIPNWYLITSIATDAVSPNANIVIRMFYVILFVIVAVFGISLFYFLTYKNKQQSNLEHIAFVDHVTKGNTYNKFVVDWQRALEEQPEKQYYVMKFDIDNFKYINNFYGIDFGDRILFQIDQNVSSKLYPGKSIARISADHFVVLLENAEEKRLNNLLDSIQNEEDVVIYLSAGVYTIGDSTESIHLMIDKAGTAAQIVKGSLHKKIAFYSERYDQLMIHNEQLKRSVKQALMNDEIIPFYQPKVNVNTGVMVGAEALARWRTQEGKLVSPIEFIPMCEQTGLVVELDMVIFEKVLQFLKENMRKGIRCVPISVNFSRLHLSNKDFIANVLSKMNQYEIPPHLIEIELTESAIYDNYEMVSEFITQLHKHGFLISMDDFGSGASSLNMLKEFPIDVLKIDKGFLDKTEDDHRQHIIFAAIAQMAQQLEIKVVVEGVEFVENVELMKEVGCNVAQGYYFARPMEESIFKELYQKESL